MADDTSSGSSAETESSVEAPADSGVVRARPRLHPASLIAILLAGVAALAFLASRAFVPADCGCSGRTHRPTSTAAAPAKTLPGGPTGSKNTRARTAHSVASSTAAPETPHSEEGPKATENERSKSRTTEGFVHE